MRREVSTLADALLGLSLPVASAAFAESLRVMTLNLWVGGESGGQPLAQSTKLIQAARADVVGLQETHGRERGRNGIRNDAAAAIAKQLGWHYYDQGDEDRGIISRYKLVGHTPKDWGVAIELPSRRRVWVFNVHLMHAPYQPYQLLKIPYSDASFISTEVEAIDEARKARAAEVAELLADIKSVRGKGTAIVVTGDFNEPSSLDWTAAAAKAGKCPIAVRWPSTQTILDASFVDAYRAVHPDPLKAPGLSWTPTKKPDARGERHDRIDFVLVSRTNATAKSVEVVGEARDAADIVVTPYPSDHRGVVAAIEVK